MQGQDQNPSPQSRQTQGIDWENIPSLQQFQSILTDKKHTLLIVIFTADWCRPCLQMNVSLPNVIRMFPDVVFFKVDVDENMDTANTCGIACVPTIRIYCNGKKLHENFGWNSERLIRAISVCQDLYKPELAGAGNTNAVVPIQPPQPYKDANANGTQRAVHGSLTTHRVQAHVHGSHNDSSLQRIEVAPASNN